MKLSITVYKESGTYYTSCVAESKKDIWLWKDEFMEFIKDNLPARIGEGFVTVVDASDDQSFHNVLYRCNDLK